MSIVYANLGTQNDQPQTSSQAIFRDERAADIVSPADQYRIALMRFNLGVANAPLRYWDAGITASGTFIPSVSLENIATGIVYTTEVLFDDTDPASAIPGQGLIYTPNNLLEMVNQAFRTSFSDLNAAAPVAGCSTPPFLALENGFLAIYVPTAYAEVGGVGIGVYASALIERLFSGVARTEQTGPLNPAATAAEQATQYQWFADATPANETTLATVAYTRNAQIRPTVGQWWEGRSVLIEATGLPVTAELLSSTDGSNPSQALLTSFYVEGSAISSGGPLVFNSSGAIRWYDLTAGSVRSINCRVSYRFDGSSITRPLMLEYGEAASIRLAFRRNDLDLA